MNHKIVFRLLGKIFIAQAALLALPLIVCLSLAEGVHLSFIIPIAVLLAVGVPLSLLKTGGTSMSAKEGFALVAFAWILMSFAGSLPYVISKSIPNFASALFETVSGFTSTGASVVANVEGLTKSILLWRSLTNWIGGMGVLVFVLAILPKNDAGIIHAFRAEATGPQVGKLVSRLKRTALILYGIYFALTVLEFILLLAGGMPVFDSVCNALATAGTGGFSVRNASIGSYGSVYAETVISVFMVIFSINFNVYYLLLTGNLLKALKNEETVAFLSMLVVCFFAISLNLYFSAKAAYTNFSRAMRDAWFQVASISSTTGFSSTDFDTWPALSKAILSLLMIVGGCAGSTSGGMKMSRVAILFKSSSADIRKMVRPREIITVKFCGEPVHAETITNVRAYFTLWVVILLTSFLLISVDNHGSLTTNFSAALSAIGNIGPGFGEVGPTATFAGYSAFSKVVLCLTMLAGRLEIFPLILLFSPSTYKKI